MSSATPSSHVFPVVHRKLLNIPIHIEIQLYPHCTESIKSIEEQVRSVLQNKCAVFTNGSLNHLLASSTTLADAVHALTVTDMAPEQRVSFWQANLCLHSFRLCEQGPENDYLEGEQELPVADQWELPNQLLHGLWESIVLDYHIKSRLLNYCASSLQFAECNINTNVITWNKMVLLYGPPGTGKVTHPIILSAKQLSSLFNRLCVAGGTSKLDIVVQEFGP
jgi:pachytene checkpoint protein 2